jgi:hypothetical protein
MEIYSNDPANNDTEIAYPNNLTSKFAYDALKRLTSPTTLPDP